MKLTGLEILRADAGWRSFSFLKLMTDSGIVGWSEFNESFGSAGLGAVVQALGETLIGQDPRPTARLLALLEVRTRQARGGLNQLAIGAIENALLDLKAKDLGVPVCALFGGPVRSRIPLYWSHTGTYRIRDAALVGAPPMLTYDDLATHAAQIAAAGFRALKTNIFVEEGGRLVSFGPGFGRGTGWPELNWDRRSLDAIARTLEAVRDGVGEAFAVLLDTNFNFRTEGFLRAAETVAPFDLTWLEIDSHDPASLALIRGAAPCPVASYETLCGRRDFRPYFEAYAADVAIVDVVWNGLGEAMKIAAQAETFEVNCAPHNFYGHLSTMASAHFSAAIPNFRLMEIDIDSVAWRDEFFTTAPVIEAGELVMPTTPGWGIDVDERAVRARPAK